MDPIVKRLHEGKQVELAKSVLESAGYKVQKLKEDVQEYANNSGCVAYPSESENDPIVLNLGDAYPISLSMKIESREEAEKVYNTLVKNLNDSVADAVDYCMRRGFSISYNSNHLW